ncbi:MAG: hypothetical protein QOE77_3573 [Blastocatellia bacterium]|nr:hypothetical protein [Blastocatellia bacterium]
MKVSIHPADSLLKMTLEDSFVLNIGEFIAKTHMRATNEPLYEHTLAKISLLLLRIHTTERYTDIAYRIGTREAFSALSVKLGATTGFPLQAARRLLKLGSTSFSSEFFERCVLQRANADFLYLLRNRIQLCSSIELWLQEYLIAKIDGATK